MFARFARTRPILSLLLAGTVVSLFWVVAQPTHAQDECQLAGQVVDGATGESVGGVTVRVHGRSVDTDPEGKFCFTELDPERTLLLTLSVVDNHGTQVECLIKEVTTRFVPVSAVDGDKIAVVTASPESLEPVELRLETVTDDSVEAFCTGCHTWNPCFEGATPEQLAAIFEASIPGVFVLRSERNQFIKQLEESGLDESTYTSIRYTCVHARSSDMVAAVEEDNLGHEPTLKAPTDLPLREGRHTTCDTCHTRHGNDRKAYLQMPDDGPDSKLCKACHL